MPFADQKVVRVVRRCNLHAAGAFFHVGVFIGNDRNFAAYKRNDNLFADKMRITLVGGVDRHGCIAEQRFGTGGRNDHIFVAVLDKVFDVPV